MRPLALDPRDGYCGDDPIARAVAGLHTPRSYDRRDRACAKDHDRAAADVIGCDDCARKAVLGCLAWFLDAVPLGAAVADLRAIVRGRR